MDLGLFTNWEGVLRVVVRAVLLYGYTLCLLRLAGKRTTMTMTAFDFISTVLMATLIASTILSASISLVEGVAGLTVIVGLQTAVTYGTSRSPRFLRLVAAAPQILYRDSRFLSKRLLAERISQQQVEQTMRAAGYGTTAKIRAVIIESAGTMSIIGEEKVHSEERGNDLLEAVDQD